MENETINTQETNIPSCAVVSISTGSLDYFAEKHPNIHILRLTIYLKGVAYLDGKNIQADDFYRWIAENPDIVPTTSPPNISEAIEFFEELIDKGHQEAIVVTLSAQMSETHKIIEDVSLLLQSKIKIHLFDSGTTGAAEGLMALRAAEMLDQGFSVSDTLKKLAEIREQSVSIVCTSTFHYLIKNKKISMVSGLLGDWLKIRPILEFTTHKIHLKAKVRGTSNALSRLVDYLIEYNEQLKDAQICILYCGNERLHVSLKEKILDVTGKQPPSYPLSPVVGAYSGPKTIGVAIVPTITSK